MRNFFTWNFGLTSAPDLQKLKAILTPQGGQVIQTPSGVCVGTDLNQKELTKALNDGGVSEEVILAPLNLADEALTPDVRAFVDSARN